MGVRYGSLDGVKAKAKMFDQDFSQNDPVVNADIELLLDQASDVARDLLQTRYDLATIDANTPNAVTQFTEIVAALFLLSTWGQMVSDKSKVNNALKWLEKRKRHYKNMIINGNILDASNEPLATNPTISVSSSSSMSDLEDIYS